MLGLATHKKGRKAEHERGLSPNAWRVANGRDLADTTWQTLTIRATGRGALTAEFAVRRVWTVWQAEAAVHHIQQEGLVMPRDRDGKGYYSLSNAPVDTPRTVLARRQCHPFFIERTNQDAKSEFGWDETQTTK